MEKTTVRKKAYLGKNVQEANALEATVATKQNAAAVIVVVQHALLKAADHAITIATLKKTSLLI